MDNSLIELSLADKKKIIAVLIDFLEGKLREIQRSAEAAHGGATHEDAVAKSKYDTHGLELSYLAGAQLERAKLLESEIRSLHESPCKIFGDDDVIQHGSLINLVPERSTAPQKTFLISPYGAGEQISYRNLSITVLSPHSPLGEEVIDQYLGDTIPLGSCEQLINGHI